MNSVLAQIIADGTLVDVDFLIAVPITSDMSSWIKPAWFGYSSAKCQILPDYNFLPAGQGWKMNVVFNPPSGIWPAVALGVSYQGNPLFVALVQTLGYAEAGRVFRATIRGLMNPVFN